MNSAFKKGFTIIELVVVMSIVLIITATSVVSYHRLTSNYKEREYNRIISNFEAAAEAYVQENEDLKERIYSGAGYVTVTLKVLSQEGLINPEEKDPVSGKVFDEKNYVTVYLDENRNFHAVYMKDTGSSFTNSRDKQSILAGSLYTKVQMLEYIVGFTKGNYDSDAGVYGTKEIDYYTIDIKITDITDKNNQIVMTDNTKIPTDKNAIGHTYRIDYSYNFGDDGVKTLKRDVTVYNIAPELKTFTLTPDYNGIQFYTNENVMAKATGESVHGSVTYHYIVNGNDIPNTSGEYEIEQNTSITVYVEDIYGWKSESITKTIGFIDKVAPTFDIDTTENGLYGMFAKPVNLQDDLSGIPVKSVQNPGSKIWSYITEQYFSRNGTYTFTITDAAGNETRKSITVSNVKLYDLTNLSKEEVQTRCKGYTPDLDCRITGSQNKYAYSSSQSIPVLTPITDGMVVTVTMVAPQTSVTIKVNNGYVNGESKITVDKGESATATIKPNSGYQMSGASVVCGSGAEGSLSGETLTVKNILSNVECVVSTYKTPVVYYSSGGGGGGSSSSSSGSTCDDSCIVSKMQANSAAWWGASAKEQERLHNENESLKSQLSYGNSVSFNPSGTWQTSTCSNIYKC